MKFLSNDSPELRLLEDVARKFCRHSGVEIDVAKLLNQRILLTRWQPREQQSVGQSCCLMQTEDQQWVAINLARAEDHQLLSIFLRDVFLSNDLLSWADVRRAIGNVDSLALIEYASEVGLPISRLGEVANDYRADELPINLSYENKSSFALKPNRMIAVLDLSSLWAGPLCSRLLMDAGCQVTKVESTHRLDGSRYGHPEFFKQLNDGKDEAILDFTSASGRMQLRELIYGADVVIEGSRPRALQHLGIDAQHVLRDGKPRVWLSLTGYGRGADHGHRVGFGDDCAVAGGLVNFGPSGPQVVADAVADPLTGLISAAAVFDALESPRPVLIEAVLAKSAAWLNSVRQTT